MATLTNDWLEIMKKPAPSSRVTLNKIETKLFSEKKQQTFSLKFLLSLLGTETLCLGLITLNDHFDFLNTLFAAPIVVFIFLSPFFIFINCLYLLLHFIEVRSSAADKRTYIDQNRVELENAEHIEYDFEILTNTVKNHIRQLSELDILQMLKVKGIQPWAQNLLQKELDQRVATPITEETTLQTYEQACQNTPILRI